MLETYIDDGGIERCDNCDEETGECACTCVECGDPVMECEEPDLRAQVGRYIADTAVDVGKWAGLDEVYAEARKQRGDDPLPTSLLGDARERLARHLYLSAAPTDWRPTAELGWDRGDERIDHEKWLRHADELLAVITGKDG